MGTACAEAMPGGALWMGMRKDAMGIGEGAILGAVSGIMGCAMAMDMPGLVPGVMGCAMAIGMPPGIMGCAMAIGMPGIAPGIMGCAMTIDIPGTIGWAMAVPGDATDAGTM